MTFSHRGAERRQIGLFKIARAGINVEPVPQRFRPAVHRVMLARGHRAKMLEIVALYSSDESNTHAAGQEWIFSVGLLSPSPARITEDVDVWRPEGQSIE